MKSGIKFVVLVKKFKLHSFLTKFISNREKVLLKLFIYEIQPF